MAEDVNGHLEQLRARLVEWAERVRDGASEREFVEAGGAELGDGRNLYERAMPLRQSYAGIRRYWDKR